jgi:hypothetical protein
VAAERIERGDWLFTHDAGWAHVESTGYTGRKETVYNLTVAGAESYFVGEAGVLAHNVPGCGGGGPKGPYRGGRHGDTKGPVGDGLESHHMPARSVSPLTPDQGPAIQMDPLDHRRTASHGTQGPAGEAYRARQGQLISEGRFDDAIQMDIDDIRSKFGTKYDEAILEMIDSL